MLYPYIHSIHSIENTFVLCGFKPVFFVVVAAVDRLQNIYIYKYMKKKPQQQQQKQIQRLRMKEKKLNSFFFFYFLQSSIYLGNINNTARAGGIVTTIVVGKTCIVHSKTKKINENNNLQFVQ